MFSKGFTILFCLSCYCSDIVFPTILLQDKNVILFSFFFVGIGILFIRLQLSSEAGFRFGGAGREDSQEGPLIIEPFCESSLPAP